MPRRIGKRLVGLTKRQRQRRGRRRESLKTTITTKER